MRTCKMCGGVFVTSTMAITNTGRNTGKVWYKNVCRPCDSEKRSITARLHKENPHPGPEYPCELCGEVKDRLHLDHDWKTGEFRGWLCSGCNTGLGRFDDDVDLLKRAAKYLMRTGSNSQKTWGI